MIKICKGIRPIRRQTNRPKGYRNQQQHAKRRQIITDRKRNQNHGRLYAPIRIVNGCVVKYKAKNKYDNGCNHIRDQQRKPPRKIKEFVRVNADYCGDDVDGGNNNKTCRAILL